MPTMKTIHTAIRRLDSETLAQQLPESLTEIEINDLLLIADQAAAKEINKTTARIAKAKPTKISELVFAHSIKMQNYLLVRAVLCGDTGEDDDDDIGNISIF